MGVFKSTWFTTGDYFVNQNLKDKLTYILNSVPPGKIRMGTHQGYGILMFWAMRYPTSSGDYAVVIGVAVDPGLYIASCYNGDYRYYYVDKSPL